MRMQNYSNENLVELIDLDLFVSKYYKELSDTSKNQTSKFLARSFMRLPSLQQKPVSFEVTSWFSCNLPKIYKGHFCLGSKPLILWIKCFVNCNTTFNRQTDSCDALINKVLHVLFYTQQYSVFTKFSYLFSFLSSRKKHTV